MAHPDLAIEQAYVDDAYRCLEAMRDKTARAADLTDSAAQAVDSAIAQAHLRHRLASLDADVGGLSFGRLDDEDDDTWYVGRRHVEDARGDAVVVDWRAEVATPFYRATAIDAQGLRRLRLVRGGDVLVGPDEDGVAGLGERAARLEESARSLGASPTQIVRLVTLPILWRGMLPGAVAVFAFVFGNYEVAALLGPSSPAPLPVLIMERYLGPSLGGRADAHLLSLLALAVTTLAVIAHEVIRRRVPWSTPS